MHIVSMMANHNFLQMEQVLDSVVVDVLSYLQYMGDKSKAEEAQRKYAEEMSKKRR